MARSFDTIVVGLGAMGSAVAAQLAQRGRRVLGLDRFTPPHTFGSSHGQTRAIREAYFEDPRYVPLVQRAYELWKELEAAAGVALLQQTGGLMLGAAGGILVSGARASAQRHRLPHEVLSAAEVRRRFPPLRPGDEMVGVWEPRAGVLFAERCVAAQLEMARRHGATLRVEEAVQGWRADGDGVVVRTERGESRAAHMVLCAGPWMSALVSDLALPLTVERQVQLWFVPVAHAEQFTPDHFPIYAYEYAPGHLFYGFPDLGHGLKVARHHDGERTAPDQVRRRVDDTDEQTVRALLQRFLPEGNGALCASAVCLYTNTPDAHFVIDAHPRHRQVLIVSPCSGHGFKFASVIGEVVADLITLGRSRFDLELFALHRFAD